MSHLGEKLSAFVDGELDPAAHDRVLSHLAGCEACRFEAEMLRQLKRRLCGLDAPEPSLDFVGRLAALTGPDSDGPDPRQDGRSGPPPMGAMHARGPRRGMSGRGGLHPTRGIGPEDGSADTPGAGTSLFRRLRGTHPVRYGFTGACVLAITLGTAAAGEPDPAGDVSLVAVAPGPSAAATALLPEPNASMP